jgi:hypothetical protein
MPEARAYHLYLQWHAKLLIFGALMLLTAVGLSITTGMLPASHGVGPPRAFGILLLGIVAWYWYWVLSMPHTISVSEPGDVEFIGVTRTRHTTLREIESIKPNSSQFGFLVVGTSGGKFRILNQFDGFHDFILRLKTANPAVELRGC